MASSNSNRDLKRVAALLNSLGWQCGQTKSAHWRFVPPDPDKPIVVTGGTPSDHRAVKNFIAGLKRSGLSGGPLKRVKKIFGVRRNPLGFLFGY